MKESLSLSGILRQFRGGIALALSLVVIENVAWIIEPSVFGPVIDALIETAQGKGEGGVLAPLLVWVGIFALNSGVGATRRAVDPRIYLTIFSRIAAHVAETSKRLGLPVTRTAARAELSREFITFFQYRMPEIIEQAIAIGGSLIGLAFFDYRLALTCAVVTVPLAVATVVYSRKVLPLQTEVHDGLEDIYIVFAAQDTAAIEEYYQRIGHGQQKIARWGAAVFALMRLVLLGIFLVVLFIAIDLDDFSTGNIYTIVAYLWTFATSSEYVPELMESWTSLRDLSSRLRSEPA